MDCSLLSHVERSNNAKIKAANRAHAIARMSANPAMAAELMTPDAIKKVVEDLMARVDVIPGRSGALQEVMERKEAAVYIYL